LSGWLGEIESSPILERLRALSQTPVQTDPGTMAQLPSTQYPSLATPPPSLGEAPAGMPSQSLTEPGAPPAPRPQPKQIPGVVGKPPTFGPRKMFAGPEDTAVATAKGQYLGRGQAGRQLLREAQTPEERRLVMEQFGYSEPGRGATQGQFMGNVLGENIDPAEWTDQTPPTARQVYRRMRMPDGTVRHFPVDLTSAGAPTLREIAGPDGRPMTAQIYQDGTVVPLARSASRTQFLQHIDAAGNITYLPVNPYAAAPGAPRIGATRGQAGTPPPAAQGPAPASAAPPASPAPAVGAPPPQAGASQAPSGISGGQRPVQFSSIPVAILTPTGELTTIQADRNPRTRELFDSVTGQPLTGQAFPITSVAQQNIRSQEQLKLQLQEIQASADELLPSTDEFAAYAPAVWLSMKSNLDPTFYAKYQKLVSDVNTAAGAIRRLQGQSGAESERDYLRALSSLGNITSGDTKEAVANRLAGTLDAITAAQKSYINTLQRGQVGTAPPGTPDLSDLQPGFKRTLPNGEVWARPPNGGAPVRMSP
jgi:hypothetical protein